mgnify:CR=1 FL=1
MRKRKWLEEPVAAPAGYGNPTSAGLVGHSAETAGFEPARDLSTPTFLAGRRTRPDYATSPVGTRIACSLDRRQPPLPRCVPTFSRYAPGSATWTGGPARADGADAPRAPGFGPTRGPDAHSRFRTSAFLRMEEVCSGPLGDFRRETAQGRGMRASGVDRFRRGCRSRG